MNKKSKSFPEKDGYRHYYLRNMEHQPFGCVAFKAGSQPGTVIRGISLCSEMDQWTRESGRSKAVGRCKKAEATKLNADPISAASHLSSNTFITLFGSEFAVADVVFKTCFDVPATAREARIMVKDAEYAAKTTSNA